MGSQPLCKPDEMLDAARRGDLNVLDAMTSCYSQRLLAEGRRRCRTLEDAEDAVQEAMLSAGTHLDQFRGDGSLEGWLVRMVANACHRSNRGRKNDPSLHTTEVVVPERARSPEEIAQQGELLMLLGEVLSGLDPVDRLVFILAEGQGYKGPEIAGELGLTAQAVRSRLSRTRRRVRAQMEARVGGGAGL